MLCEICQQNQANIHYQASINGVTNSYNICSDCARKMQQNQSHPSFPSFQHMTDFPSFGLLPDFSMADFIGGFFNNQTAHKEPYIQQAVPPGTDCPGCGMTLGEFRKLGRVGCGMCYGTFGAYLPELLRRIHGNTVHSGKVPESFSVEVSAAGGVAPDPHEDLRQALQAAVAREDFEEAARLRDLIKVHESEGGQAHA